MEIVCFLNQRVAWMITEDGTRAIIVNRHFADSIIISPGTDVLGQVGCHIVKADFQQHAVFQVGFAARQFRVAQAYAAAAVFGVIKGGITLDLNDAVYADCLCQLVVKLLTALDLCGPLLTAPCADGSVFGRINPDVDIFRKAVDDAKPLRQ